MADNIPSIDDTPRAGQARSEIAEIVYWTPKTKVPFIYGLVDPLEPKHVRYVGMASTTPLRPYAHIKNAKNNKKHSHLLHWVRKLTRENRQYDVIILEQLSDNTTRNFLGFVERCYVSSLCAIGHNLTNEVEGGNGGNLGQRAVEKMKATLTGRKLSADHREKLSTANRKRYENPEERKKTSERGTGQKRSLQSRKKMSEAQKGRTISEEQREKLAQAHIGLKASPETRARLSETSKGNQHALGLIHTSESRSKMSEKVCDAWTRGVYSARKKAALTPVQKLQQQLNRENAKLARLRQLAGED